MKKHIIRILLILLAVLLLLYAALKIYVTIEAKKRADAPGNASSYNVGNLEKHEDSSVIVSIWAYTRAKLRSVR